MRAEIEAGIRAQCGGDLCLDVRNEQRDIDGFTECAFVATEPAQRTTVPRGTTVVIVSGSAPCEEPPPEPVDTPAPETTTPSSEPSTAASTPAEAPAPASEPTP